MPWKSGSLHKFHCSSCDSESCRAQVWGIALTCDSRVKGSIPLNFAGVWGEELAELSLREVWDDFESLLLIHRAWLGSNPSHRHSSSWAPA